MISNSDIFQSFSSLTQELKEFFISFYKEIIDSNYSPISIIVYNDLTGAIKCLAIREEDKNFVLEKEDFTNNIKLPEYVIITFSTRWGSYSIQSLQSKHTITSQKQSLEQAIEEWQQERLKNPPTILRELNIKGTKHSNSNLTCISTMDQGFIDRLNNIN